MPVSRPTAARLASSAQTQQLAVSVENDGTVSGTAAPGTRIEVANLSTAATGHLLPHDVVEVAVADASGKFSFRLAGALGGDVLQVQARANAQSPASATL